jgi:hypothetical protein
LPAPGFKAYTLLHTTAVKNGLKRRNRFVVIAALSFKIGFNLIRRRGAMAIKEREVPQKIAPYLGKLESRIPKARSAAVASLKLKEQGSPTAR